jgi:aldehyde dehydrogenase (NAD+)
MTPAAEPPVSPASSTAEIDRLYALQQARRAAVAQTTARERIAKIRKLHDALMSRRDEIRAALWADYRKPAAEVDLSEIYPALGEARHAMRHLKRWMKPRGVMPTLTLLGSRSRVLYEPKGVVLIISPWNFPINLTLGPLVSAIAAGNCAILKPSEMTPNSAAVMKRIVGDLFDESEVAMVEGDAGVAAELLRRRWDHIFFTGSPAVGKIVMKAAAEHLTSVTLELGGKSPVIVDRSANLDEAARKIAWGKFFNSGQICIAPDYLLVDETVAAPFTAKLKSAINDLSAEGTRGLLVNERHAGRVKGLLDSAVAAGARVIHGGGVHDRDIEPTVLADVPPNAAVMREEIFGPLLPMLTYGSREEAYRLIGEREKPLVLYLFSRERKVVREVLARTTAGGTVVNDTLVHFYQTNLPFGGVGNSGVGKSHGFYGFEAFSNARGVLSQPTRFSIVQLVYPPYTKLRQWLIDFTLRWM